MRLIIYHFRSECNQKGPDTSTLTSNGGSAADAVFFHSIDQYMPGYIEGFGGPGLVAVMALQSPENRPAFNFFQRQVAEIDGLAAC